MLSDNGKELPAGVKCSTSKIRDSSSDEDVPLSILRTKYVTKQRKEPVRRKLIDDKHEEEENLTDDYCLDKSYDPNKDYYNSTDSEATEFKKPKRKKRKLSKQDKKSIKANTSSNLTKSDLKLKLRKSIKVLQSSRKRKKHDSSFTELQC